jgi:hypothetical protein
MARDSEPDSNLPDVKIPLKHDSSRIWSSRVKSAADRDPDLSRDDLSGDMARDSEPDSNLPDVKIPLKVPPVTGIMPRARWQVDSLRPRLRVGDNRRIILVTGRPTAS